ncbi:MAG: bifunctional diguanylate cyclase/phosphodiesterase [Pseudomonadota bacterium]
MKPAIKADEAKHTSAPASNEHEPAGTSAPAEYAHLIEALFQPGHRLDVEADDNDRHIDQIIEGEAFQTIEAGTELDETAYVWNLLTDKMDWEANARSVLQLADETALQTGNKFNGLLAPEHFDRRLKAFAETGHTKNGRTHSGQKSIPFRVHYRLQPKGLRSSETIWVEDHGRCWLNAGGNPVRARGIVRRISEGYIETQNRQHFNEFDELTGQLNRIKLTEALEAVIQRSKGKGQTSGFLIAAVNNLSIINESFGFDVGDEVIKSTADMIKQRLRGGDTLGRYSSNKFGIILNDCGVGAMRIAAERFMKAVRTTTLSTSACQLSATISVGGIIIPQHAETAERATSCALQALDIARQKKNDTYVAFAPSRIQQSLRQRNIKMADSIMLALDENRMRLLLQPMVNAKTGNADIHECLLRMEKQDGSLVSAGEFVPVAEQLGLARLLDKRVLELALDLLEQQPELVLSVNVSSLTTTDQDWMGTLCKSTVGRRDLTSRLIVEITETAAIDDIDRTSLFVDTLKDIGCRVAIDDFGAGYTSFKTLKHLACDIVKIDGAFVKNLVDDKADRVFIKTMVELAETFQMETVAEWVGDQEVEELLRQSGITYLQGFLYGQPMTIAEYLASAEGGSNTQTTALMSSTAKP